MSRYSATKESKIPFNIPKVDIPCFTFFRIFGDLTSGTPVIMLHGGPGSGHETLLPFSNLWPRYGVPVILYDQIGCGGSTRLPQTVGDTSLWQESLFISQLDSLIKYLRLRNGFHVFGHSWGGSLAAAFACGRPQGLQRLVLASGLASKELSIRGRNLKRKELPPDVQQAIDEGEEKGQYDGPAYKEAMGYFWRNYMCRADPYPPVPLAITLSRGGEVNPAMITMNGASPWQSTGTMANWTCIPRLPQINVPTLVYNTEFDSSHDIATAPFFEHIPRVRWITIAGGSHIPHLDGQEMREKILKLVGEFLTENRVANT